MQAEKADLHIGKTAWIAVAKDGGGSRISVDCFGAGAGDMRLEGVDVKFIFHDTLKINEIFEVYKKYPSPYSASLHMALILRNDKGDLMAFGRGGLLSTSGLSLSADSVFEEADPTVEFSDAILFHSAEWQFFVETKSVEARIVSLAPLSDTRYQIKTPPEERIWHQDISFVFDTRGGEKLKQLRESCVPRWMQHEKK